MPSRGSAASRRNASLSHGKDERDVHHVAVVRVGANLEERQEGPGIPDRPRASPLCYRRQAKGQRVDMVGRRGGQLSRLPRGSSRPQPPSPPPPWPLRGCSRPCEVPAPARVGAVDAGAGATRRAPAAPSREHCRPGRAGRAFPGRGGRRSGRRGRQWPRQGWPERPREPAAADAARPWRCSRRRPTRRRCTPGRRSNRPRASGPKVPVVRLNGVDERGCRGPAVLLRRHLAERLWRHAGPRPGAPAHAPHRRHVARGAAVRQRAGRGVRDRPQPPRDLRRQTAQPRDRRRHLRRGAGGARGPARTRSSGDSTSSATTSRARGT